MCFIRVHCLPLHPNKKTLSRLQITFRRFLWVPDNNVTLKWKVTQRPKNRPPFVAQLQAGLTVLFFQNLLAFFFWTFGGLCVRCWLFAATWRPVCPLPLRLRRNDSWVLLTKIQRRNTFNFKLSSLARNSFSVKIFVQYRCVPASFEQMDATVYELCLARSLKWILQDLELIAFYMITSWLVFLMTCSCVRFCFSLSFNFLSILLYASYIKAWCVITKKLIEPTLKWGAPPACRIRDVLVHFQHIY